MKSKRLIAWLLCLCMVVGLGPALPAISYADGEDGSTDTGGSSNNSDLIDEFDMTNAAYDAQTNNELIDGGWVPVRHTKAAEGKNFYLIKSDVATTHHFTLSTTLITVDSLSFEGAGASNVEIKSISDGVTTIEGDLYIAGNATSLTVKNNNEKVMTFNIDREKLDPAVANGKVYIIDIQPATLNSDGSLSMKMSGINISENIQKLAVGNTLTEWDNTTNRSKIIGFEDYYRGSSVIEDSGEYTVTFAKGSVDPYAESNGEQGDEFNQDQQKHSAYGGLYCVSGEEYEQLRQVDGTWIDYNLSWGLDRWAYNGINIVIPREAGGDTPYTPTAGASVSLPSQTTSASVTASINYRVYTEMRHAWSSSALSSASWEAISSSVSLTIPDASSFGQKTVYFQFRDAEGNTSSEITASTNYLSSAQTAAPAYAAVREQSGKDVNYASSASGVGAYKLAANNDYTLYMEAAEGDTGHSYEAVLRNGSGSDLVTVDLSPVSGRLGVYAGDLKYSDASDANSIAFRAKKGEYESQSGAEYSINIEWVHQPIVYRGMAPWLWKNTIYDGGNIYYLVAQGANIYVSFSGTAAKTPIVELKYKNNAGADSTKEYGVADGIREDTGSAGLYSGTINLPGDAASLTSVEYYLDDTTAGRSEARTYNLSQYRVQTSLEITDFPDRFKDTWVYLESSSASGSSSGIRYSPVIDGGGEGKGLYAAFNNASANTAYTLSLYGDSGIIASSGSISLNYGKNSKSFTELFGDIKYGNVSFLDSTAWGENADSGRVYLDLELTYAGGRSAKFTVSPGETLNMVPVGAKIKYKLGTYAVNKDAKMLAGGTDGVHEYTVVEGDQRISFTVLPFGYTRISGRVLMNGSGVADVFVSAKQELKYPPDSPGGAWQTYEYFETRTDKNGEYSLNVISGYDAEIEVSAIAARVKSGDESKLSIPGSSLPDSGNYQHGDISIEYHNTNILTPSLYVYNLKDEAGNIIGSTKELTIGDPSVLLIDKVTKGSDRNSEYVLEKSEGDNGSTQYVMYKTSGDSSPINKDESISYVRVYYTLPEGSDYILVNGSIGESMTNEPYYYAWLNEAGSGTARAYAKQAGSLMATVVPEDDSGALGYLAVFDSAHRLIGVSSGVGALEIGGIKVDGSYEIFSFKVNASDNLDDEALSQIINYTTLNALSTSASSKVKKATLNMKAGVVYELDEAVGSRAAINKPTEAIKDSDLGNYHIRATASETEDYNGDMRVRATIEPRGKAAGKAYITKVEVSRTDATNSGNKAIYINGKDAGTSSNYTGSFNLADKTDSLVLNFVAGKNATDGHTSAKITVTSQDESGKEALDVYELYTVPGELYLSMADEIVSGSEARNFNIEIHAKTGDEVSIYDNGGLIGKQRMLKSVEKVKMTLKNADEPGMHIIYAEVRDSGGKVIKTSDKYNVYAADGGKKVYAGHFVWNHHNDSGNQTWTFENLSDIAGVTFRYYPSRPSTVTFRIYNAKGPDYSKFSGINPDNFPAYTEGSHSVYDQYASLLDDVDLYDVYLITIYYGAKTYWPARCITPSGVDANGTYSEWQVADENFFFFDGFGVAYELLGNAQDSYRKLAGTTREDYVNLTLNDGSTVDLSSLTDPRASIGPNLDLSTAPALVRDNADKLEATTSDSEFKVEMKNPGEVKNGDGKANVLDKFEVSVKAIRSNNLTDEKLYAAYEKGILKGWSFIETEQGRVWIQEVQLATDNTYDPRDLEVAAGQDSISSGVNTKAKTTISTTQRYYFPKALSEAIFGANYSAATEVTDSFLEDGKSESDLELMSVDSGGGSGGMQLMAISEETENFIMDGVEFTSNTAGILDYIGDATKNKIVSDGVGNVVNGIDTAASIYSAAKGPSGKSASALWSALGQVNDESAIRTLSRDIQEYEEARLRNYASETSCSAVTTSGGWVSSATPPVKAALVVGGMGASVLNRKAANYVEQMYDHIMASIQHQIAHEREIQRRKDEEERNRRRKIEERKDQWRRIANRILDEDPNDRMRRLGIITDEEELPKFRMYIDPSGYVFEATEDNRVEGITATLYQGSEDTLDKMDTTAGSYYSKWADDNINEAERQDNPQTTNDEGRYGWMTPSGVWKVNFSDESGKYLSTETKAMQVAPEHTTVNIGLLSTEVPEVAGAEKLAAASAGGSDKITIHFKNYMQMESLVDVTGVSGTDFDGTATAGAGADWYTAEKSAIRFYDEFGNFLAGKMSFEDDRVANTGYTADGENSAYQTDIIGSKFFVKSISFTPDPYEDGRKPDMDKAGIVVSSTAMSYSGIAMGEDYEKTLAQAVLDYESSKSGDDDNSGSKSSSGSTPAGIVNTVPVGDETSEDEGSKEDIDTSIVSEEMAESLGMELEEAALAAKAAGEEFSDVSETQWFAAAVGYATGKGYFKGHDDGTFEPNGNATREQIMAVLHRFAEALGIDPSLEGDREAVEGLYPVNTELIGVSNWAKEDVAWAISAGISDGTDPKGEISREQFVTMLFRLAVQSDASLAEKYSARAGLSSFPDASQTHEYAAAAMAWAVDLGIITGYEDGTLQPRNATTRAQIATIITRIDKKDLI